MLRHLNNINCKKCPLHLISPKCLFSYGRPILSSKKTCDLDEEGKPNKPEKKLDGILLNRYLISFLIRNLN